MAGDVLNHERIHLHHGCREYSDWNEDEEHDQRLGYPSPCVPLLIRKPQGTPIDLKDVRNFGGEVGAFKLAVLRFAVFNLSSPPQDQVLPSL